MATKLSQILAVEQGVKNDTTRKLTDLHRDVQKPQLLSGLSRTYQPKNEDGDQLPPESTKVQLNAETALADAEKLMTRLFDVTLTKDLANTQARASVVIDGTTILEKVPATFLLWLEKRLTDLHTFMAKLPVLDPSEDWDYDTNRGVYVTQPAKTVRTRKQPKALVTYKHTTEHPAQVHIYNEDLAEGEWTLTKFSGALPADRVRALTDRTARLLEAVKMAREEANTVTVTDAHAGEAIFRYIYS